MRGYLSFSLQAFLTVSSFICSSGVPLSISCVAGRFTIGGIRSPPPRIKGIRLSPYPLTTLLLVSKFPAGTMLCHFFIVTLLNNVTFIYHFSNMWYIFCPLQPHLFEHIRTDPWGTRVAISEPYSYGNFQLQMDRRIRGFGIRGFSYSRLAAAQKQIGKLKK